jgi:hypothetical protein
LGVERGESDMHNGLPTDHNEMTPEQRLISLLHVFGWTGGTIHQVARETGCSAADLLHGTAPGGYGPTARGFSAVRTCSPEFNRRVNFPRAHGDLSFWIGAAWGQWLHENGVPSFAQAG